MRTAYIAEGAYTFLGGESLTYLPYIRWNDNGSAGWQSYIAVQNIGSNNAVDIRVEYYDQKGTLAATHVLADSGQPLAPLQKANSYAGSGSAGAAKNGQFSGSAIVRSDQPVLVVVRNAFNVSLGSTTRFAEDYTGIRFP